MLEGRQTQFYIDVVYGVLFAAGFSVLLFVGMDVRVAAFQGGLVLGYFLRVWENMSAYERVLREEVAAEAEDAVARELGEQVPQEVTEEIGARLPAEVTAEIQKQLTEEISDEIREKVGEEVSRQIDEELERRLTDLSGHEKEEA